jgi:formate hydrogenlyase subunit 3/multisubunit Na+/H+ antiporter MnhD subunit
MVHGMRFMLLVFAMVGFAAAGAALAVTRHRLLGDGERDLGLAAIAAMFLLFGTLCTIAASGIFGVLAFGGVVTWGSYLLMGQRLGLFSIETRPGPPPELEPNEYLKRR